VESVEALGINPIDVTHTPGKVSPWRLDEKMIMIG
jgi:hypothetical protein